MTTGGSAQLSGGEHDSNGARASYSCYYAYSDRRRRVAVAASAGARQDGDPCGHTVRVEPMAGTEPILYKEAG